MDYRYLDIERAMGFMGDAQGVRDMLSVLCATLKTDLPKMQERLRSNDLPALQKNLHSLKGFIPIFSTQALADQLIALERMARTPDLALDAKDFQPQCEALWSAIAYLGQEAENYLAQPM